MTKKDRGKTQKRVKIDEGSVKKGGKNDPPKKPRPSPPDSQEKKESNK